MQETPALEPAAEFCEVCASIQREPFGAQVPVVHPKPVTQSMSVVQVDLQAIASAQVRLPEHAIGDPCTHVPWPLQALGVTVLSVHAEPHVVVPPGYVQAAAFTPSQAPPQVVDVVPASVPVQAALEPCGAPTTGEQVPIEFERSQA